MGTLLVVVLVVVSFDGCILDRAVHAFNLTNRPWMVWLGDAESRFSRR